MQVHTGKCFLDNAVILFFSDNPPSADCVRAVQELAHLTEKFSGCNIILDPRKSLKIKDVQYIGKIDKKQKLEGTMDLYDCTHCPQLEDHVGSQNFYWPKFGRGEGINHSFW